MKRTLLLITLLLATLTRTVASEPADSAAKPMRPVMSAYSVAAGSAQLVNTYLTPLKYEGWSAAFNYERMQAMRFNPESWVMRLAVDADINRTQNPARNAQLWRLVADVSWGMTHRWQLPHNITLAAGGSTGLDLGVVYSTRNGNNPVAIEAAWTINLTGYAAWQTRLMRRPLTLRYQPVLPLLGTFFSPDYGELLYEVYLGNTHGLAHFAWPGAYMRFDNLLTADYHLGTTALRLGLRCRLLSTRVNHITTRAVAIQAVVGVAGDWISLAPNRSPDPAARIINALY